MDKKIIDLDDGIELLKYNENKAVTGIFKYSTGKGTNGLMYTIFYKKDGFFHRVDGPAVEWSDGTESFYVDGSEMTKETFLNKYSKLGRILYG